MSYIPYEITKKSMKSYILNYTQQIPTLDIKISKNTLDLEKVQNPSKSNLKTGFSFKNLSITLLFGYRLFVRITFLSRGLS